MKLTVSLGQNSYDILVERGMLDSIGSLLNLNRRVLIITDDGVPAEYAQKVAGQSKNPFVFTIKSGEESKNIDSYKNILSYMVENNFTRTDCVVAVGGGVVGDLAGFAAATYMRGVDFYNIPTTLLSQIDSSIGGKTGINFGGFKNIVGAFYQPKRVIIDPDVLQTLPPRLFSNGLAEAIKMAATCDAKLFEIFEKEDITGKIDEIIVKSLNIKKEVVEKDEKESGLRRVLNFGHTVGHAIESLNTGLLHGECVALGMIPMSSPKARAKIIKALENTRLPSFYDYDAEKLIAAIAHDKKASGNNINIVYVEEIGSFKIIEKPIDSLREMLMSAF
ncbi:MAG: 3-dehydroquinate synthase [Eubacteriales bacterium]|jgi:3-dehydroquinate synthase